jgi:hypothetical protein
MTSRARKRLTARLPDFRDEGVHYVGKVTVVDLYVHAIWCLAAERHESLS